VGGLRNRRFRLLPLPLPLPLLQLPDDRRGFAQLQRLAPINELDRIEAALTGEGLMHGRPRLTHAGGELPHGKAQLVCAGLEQPGESLVSGALERLLGREACGFSWLGTLHSLAKRVDSTVPKKGTV